MIQVLMLSLHFFGANIARMTGGISFRKFVEDSCGLSRATLGCAGWALRHVTYCMFEKLEAFTDFLLKSHEGHRGWCWMLTIANCWKLLGGVLSGTLALSAALGYHFAGAVPEIRFPPTSFCGREVRHAMQTGTVTGRWVPINLWIYTSEVDPFCYHEVHYTTWWLQDVGTEGHCQSALRDAGCVTYRFSDEGNSVGFLQDQRTARCVGLKHTNRQIRASTNGWRRIYKHYPPLFVTPGEVYMYKSGTLYQPVIDFALNYSLVLADGKLVNMLGLDGLRSDIPEKWFRMGPPQGLKALIKRGGNRGTWFSKGKPSGPCTYIAHVTSAGCVARPGDPCGPCNTTFRNVEKGRFLLSRGHDRGLCAAASFSELDLHMAHEEISVDEQTHLWWVDLVKRIFNEVANLFSDLIAKVFGSEWQIAVVAVVVAYYLTVSATRNAVVGAGVAIGTLTVFFWQ
jgi:hypothetical protein